MILAKNCEEAKKRLLGKVINGIVCRSRYGDYISSKPAFVVVEKSTPAHFEFDYEVCGESYVSRFDEALNDAVRKLKNAPHTRRVSIPIWKPKDHRCRTPPAITEISYLLVDGELHLTAYLRSLECLHYFEFNFDFLCWALERMCNATSFTPGTIGMVVGVPHIYLRDVKRAEDEAEDTREEFGFNRLGTHIVDDYISSAWHTALDIIYGNGMEKETEWGEMFEGQGKSRFLHRLFIEVKNPEENRLHDKAPFTESYGVEYAHDYIIHAAKIDGEVKEPILKDGDEYSYAERARFCEKDDVRVDQLYEAIKKLREDKCRRDCYVGISRKWDLLSPDPPCLRGYQFVFSDRLYGVFYMRSNDAYGAMHANMFAFSLLTSYVAQIVGAGNYGYFHFSVDAHIYSEFLDAVREILYPDSPSYSEFMKQPGRERIR